MTTVFQEVETKNVKGEVLPWVPFAPYHADGEANGIEAQDLTSFAME